MEQRWQRTNRAVCRARSKAEFIARLGIVAEEADEAVLWLELLTESAIVKTEMTADLLKEARELAAILTASQQTAKKGRRDKVLNYPITKFPNY